MKIHSTVFFIITVLTLTGGARTFEVDVLALGPIGTGLSADGWAVTNVSNYGDSYSNALRLNVKASFMRSPSFEEVITQLELDVVSSNVVDRRLAIAPIMKGVTRKDRKVLCAYTPTKNRFTVQSFTWPRTEKVEALAFFLDGGGSTGWGIRKMKLTLEPPPLPFVVHVK